MKSLVQLFKAAGGVGGGAFSQRKPASDPPEAIGHKPF